MLAWAESKEEVLRALKEDVYSQSGVWDWEKVRIHPVCTLFALSVFGRWVLMINTSSSPLSSSRDVFFIHFCIGKCKLVRRLPVSRVTKGYKV